MANAVGESACCALPSDCQAKIQPVIAAFLAGEFDPQPAFCDNTGGGGGGGGGRESMDGSITALCRILGCFYFLLRFCLIFGM